LFFRTGMRRIRPGSIRLRCAWVALASLALASYARAATLEIEVVDELGQPVQRVAVYATAAEGRATPLRSAVAVMDQQNHRFVPHVLVVQKGTAVEFPNHDDVSHHVYSFSPAKTFELPLYKGQVYSPVVFDEAGVVVLGCNIHDGMLGYIRVLDTPYFALTNDEGVARIDDVPNGDYLLEAWTPRVRPAGLPAAQPLQVGASVVVSATVRLTGRLAPDHDHGSSSLSWERY
jgi:plastocyanin